MAGATPTSGEFQARFFFFFRSLAYGVERNLQILQRVLVLDLHHPVASRSNTPCSSRYLDAGYGRELFFYFFESRSSPTDDPVIMYVDQSFFPVIPWRGG